MLIELHILQNFAPANLNRDDTGSPKDCEFGGVRRARISSQALKRAARQMFKDQGLLPAEQLAVRTKRAVDALAARLTEGGRDQEQARAVAQAALATVKLKAEREKDSAEYKSQYLLFLAEREIARVAEICAASWDALMALTAAEPAAGGRSARAAKQAGKEAAPEVTKAMQAALDGGKAADLALFGRMLADLPDKNIDAAAQVAHALSTHRVSIEFDYYTAVDDLRPNDTQGADMIGTVEFNSACYYRYSNVDTGQLLENLGGDAGLARATLAAYLQAAVRAIPTGKQNSFAAQQAPSFVLAVARPGGPWSLANAFAKPVRPRGETDLVAESVEALAEHWARSARMYGANFAPAGAWLATMTDTETLGALGGYDAGSVQAVVAGAVAAVFGPGAGGTV